MISNRRNHDLDFNDVSSGVPFGIRIVGGIWFVCGCIWMIGATIAFAVAVIIETRDLAFMFTCWLIIILLGGAYVEYGIISITGVISNIWVPSVVSFIIGAIQILVGFGVFVAWHNTIEMMYLIAISGVVWPSGIAMIVSGNIAFANGRIYQLWRLRHRP